MAFDVPAAAYDRFMGRYADPLAPQLADLAGVRRGQRVLDVGCGPGALTAVLAERVGHDAVSAIDPSPSFVAAVRARLPGVDVRQGTAEELPYDDGTFDVTLAQLVVHFMRDPVAGLREMRRVTGTGGVVAACVWDHAGGRGPLSPFWSVVNELRAGVRDESGLAGSRAGQLEELAAVAGLHAVEPRELTVTVHYADFEEWWEPYTLGVGPAGDFVSGLDPAERETIRAACEQRLSAGPFDVGATAWTVTARV
ncbi:class I SAM-dependent methyltransferase [Nocardioides sp. MAHUQ-72]|uniref:class I SAM-dependent methyltransferase n=1 Tax=unclassified Nocardioides TaxID=2615069 RepID=UPI00361C4D26